jgi:hypothetical protein
VRSLAIPYRFVNSDATAKLITKAVIQLKSDLKVSRAEAQRRSIPSTITIGTSWRCILVFCGAGAFR